MNTLEHDVLHGSNPNATITQTLSQSHISEFDGLAYMLGNLIAKYSIIINDNEQQNYIN